MAQNFRGDTRPRGAKGPGGEVTKPTYNIEIDAYREQNRAAT